MTNTKSMKSTLATCAAVLLLSLSGVANAQNTQGQVMQHDAKDMKQSMPNMDHKMGDMPTTGDADQYFAMMMKSHHQAGIEMAEKELKNGKDTKMKAMAKKIISDQTKEIANLNKWMETNKPMK